MSEVRSEFLYGDMLTERLRALVRGEDVKIAAAFWSAEGINDIFGESGMPKAAEIICDIAMGATSAAALEALGAPKNKRLRHHERLHAKVYISSAGLIVGSANVSSAAVGGGGAFGRTLEAATFHSPDALAWHQAVRWFDDLHARSPQIRENDVERARLSYRPPRISTSAAAPRNGSLLDLVAAAPERFSNLSFVFTNVPNDEEDIIEARASAIRLGTGLPKSELAAWGPSLMFTGWSGNEVDRWKPTFIEFWLGGARPRIYAYRAAVLDRDNGSVLARRDWRAVRRVVDCRLPSAESIERLDRDIARSILGDVRGGLVFSDGEALATQLVALQT